MNKQRKCQCEPHNRERKWYWHGNGRLSVDVETGDVFIGRSNPAAKSGYGEEVKLNQPFNYCPICGGAFRDSSTFNGESTRYYTNRTYYD